MARQGRQSKSRRRRRRRNRGGAPTVLILLCVVVAVVAILTAMTIFFKVRRVALSGETRYTQEEITVASGLHDGDNLILFNKFRAIDRIFAACPYLDTVRMRRRLPDTVEIFVTECVPVAVVEDTASTIPDPKNADKQIPIGGTGKWLMDVNGKLLEQVPSRLSGLCYLKGLTLKEPKIGKYVVFSDEDLQKPVFLLLNTAKDDGILQDIGEIDFSELYNIRFTYTERFTVAIGSTEELEKKMRYLRLITEDKLSANAVGVIDLSDTQKARFIPSTNER